MAAHSDHVAYANETEAEEKRAASGYYWMASGNFIMREIMRRPSVGLRQKILIVNAGRIFGCRHISRWRAMISRSM